MKNFPLSVYCGIADEEILSSFNDLVEIYVKVCNFTVDKLPTTMFRIIILLSKNVLDLAKSKQAQDNN